MKSLEPGDDSLVHPSGQTRTDGRNSDGQSAVVGNERMTAPARAVLLVLILVELVSSAILRTLLSVHVFVGASLSGPLVVKLCSPATPPLPPNTHPPPLLHNAPP